MCWNNVQLFEMTIFNTDLLLTVLLDLYLFCSQVLSAPVVLHYPPRSLLPLHLKTQHVSWPWHLPRAPTKLFGRVRRLLTGPGKVLLTQAPISSALYLQTRELCCRQTSSSSTPPCGRCPCGRPNARGALTMQEFLLMRHGSQDHLQARSVLI